MAIISCPSVAQIGNTQGGVSRYVMFQAVITKGSADRTYDITFQAQWSQEAPLWNSGNAYVKILINNDRIVNGITRIHPSLSVTTESEQYTFVGTKDNNGGVGRFKGINHGVSWVNIYSCTINAATNNEVVVNKIEIDTSETTGDNEYYGGSNKPGVAMGPNDNWTKGSITNWNFHIENFPELTYGSKPTVSNLRNNNPYKYDMDGTQKTMNNVSEYIDGIYVKCDLNNGGAAITKAEYSANGGAWTTYNGTGDVINLRDLPAGTKYDIKVRYTNSVGSTEAGPITIYTLHKSPKLTITRNDSKSTGTNLIFDWTSDKPLSYLQYEMEDKVYKVKIPANATSGIINIGVGYGGSAVIKAKGRSNEAYHYRWSGEPAAAGNTPPLPPPTVPGIIFGLPFTVGVSPSDNIYASVGLSVKKAWYVAVTATGSGSSITVNPSQAHWDAFYKQFPKNTEPNPNQLECVLGIEVHYMVTKYDEEGNAYEEEEESSYTIDPKYVVLTGIAKTAHIGVSNSPRRAQVWYGDSSGSARRGVTWVGASGGTYRCI